MQVRIDGSHERLPVVRHPRSNGASRALEPIALLSTGVVASAVGSLGEPANGVDGGTVLRLNRLWKRYVTKRPDGYQITASFPTERTDGVEVGFGDCLETLERLCEGRIDVRARVSSVTVESDRIPAAQFDPDAVDDFLDAVEDLYEGRSVVSLEKWRTVEGELVRAYVVVPVKPLFASRPSEEPRTVPSAAEAE